MTTISPRLPEKKDPDDLFRVALAHHQEGRLADAARFYRLTLSIRSDHATTHNNLGVLLLGQGDISGAVQCFDRALALKPDYANAHNNLGNALKAQGNRQNAIDSFRRALALNPGHADAHNNLGNVLREQEDMSGAVECFQCALALNPRHADAFSNLGVALRALGDAAGAARCYRQALQIEPTHADAEFNLGNALKDMGDGASAIACYRRALEIRPGQDHALYNLGDVLREQGDVVAAIASFKAALDVNPGYVQAHYQLLDAEKSLMQWHGSGAMECLVTASLQRPQDAIPPFSPLSWPEIEPRTQLALSRNWAVNQCGALLDTPPLFRSRTEGGRLRIGYLSADLRQHAVAQLLVEVLERHDRQRFEVYAYAWGPDDGKPLTRRIRAGFDVFRDISAMSDQASARQIAEDGIDILVDLMGYTRHSRSRILACRPAPVQVNWLGYLGSLGHERLADYLIGDPVVTPPENSQYYSEHLALMPSCFQPNDRQCAIGPTPSRAQAGLPEDAVVLASFNQSYKLTPAVFDVWCRVLVAIPEALLWVVDGPEVMRSNFLREAQARGVARERIVFAHKLPLDQHLGRLRLADLALDTYPYGSGTTGANALWSAVPLVAIRGEHFVSRMSASLLNGVGLPELVTGSLEEYERVIIDLARDPVGRLRLRQRLETNRLTCPLFDSARFTSDLERLYQRMWANHQAGTHGALL